MDAEDRVRGTGSQTTLGGNGTAILVFDGRCALCRKAAWWAGTGFRHGERVAPWQSLSDERLATLALSADDVAGAAWWVEADGTRERGHRAAGKALEAGGGALVVVGRLLLTPPVSWLGGAVYPVVAWWTRKRASSVGCARSRLGVRSVLRRVV